MARFAVFLLWLLHFLPFRWLVALGEGLGALLYRVGGERRRVALTNLRLCFPQWTEAEREALAKRNFQMFARSFLERSLLWWSRPARINRLIRVEGLEHFDTAAKNGPVIMLAPHFVALDVAGAWIAQHYNCSSMYSEQKNPVFNALLLRGRLRFGEQKLFSRHDGLRPLVRVIRDGYPFYYLPDQDLGTKDGIFVPFFGVQAATLTTVARLAKVTGAKLVPCIARMLPDAQGYEVRFYPPWDHYPCDDIEADTRRVNAFIEERVLEIPEQYFWLHKRFKTRPEGEKGFYE